MTRIKDDGYGKAIKDDGYDIDELTEGFVSAITSPFGIGKCIHESAGQLVSGDSVFLLMPPDDYEELVAPYRSSDEYPVVKLHLCKLCNAVFVEKKP